MQKMREDNDSDDESLIETFMKLSEDPTMDICFLSAIETYKKNQKSFLGDSLIDSNVFSIFLQHLRNWLCLCNFTDSNVNLLE